MLRRIASLFFSALLIVTIHAQIGPAQILFGDDPLSPGNPFGTDSPAA